MYVLEPRTSLAVAAVALALVALWPQGEAAAQQGGVERLYVGPISPTTGVSVEDADHIRRTLMARIRSHGQVHVVPPFEVERHFEAVSRTHGLSCTTATRSCVTHASKLVGVSIMVEPRVSATVSSTGRRQARATLSASIFEVDRRYTNTYVSEEGYGPSALSALRDPLDVVGEEIADYASRDPSLRWRRPPMVEDQVWVGLRGAWIPWGQGDVELREEASGSSARESFSDDALYGFGLVAAYFTGHFAVGPSFWWFPSIEFELDGAERGRLAAFDPGGQTSIIGGASASADELNANLYMEGSLSWAELTGDANLTELILFANAEGGYAVAFPGEDREGLRLPQGWNAGGGVGFMGMGDRYVGWRLALHARWFELAHPIEATGGMLGRGELEARAEGLRLMLLLGFWGSG